MDVKEAIGKAKTEAKKRKFTQSVDLFINFKELDFAKPENKINLEVQLPKGRGKARKVCVIGDAELASNAKGVADRVVAGADLEGIAKDKKALKELAEGYDFFLAQPNVMGLIGKHLGQALGPRGKMPKPIPPNANLKPMIEKLKLTVVVRTKGKNLPVVHVPIGVESMSDDDLAANANAVLGAVKNKLPQHEQNIKDAYVKLSMGPVVEFDVGGAAK